jgi:aryl-alcohol dehydrogenase-like predicted oxidoreductase
MNVQVTRRGADMEFLSVPFKVSRIALGTWAIGGWMWGGTNEDESIRTICAALDCGINLIDTAPVYGFGRSEEIIGRALAQGGRRKQALIATKTGLDWKDNKPFRNASRSRIIKEMCRGKPKAARQGSSLLLRETDAYEIRSNSF